jgi:ribose transport system substrate-binding protein
MLFHGSGKSGTTTGLSSAFYLAIAWFGTLNSAHAFNGPEGLTVRTQFPVFDAYAKPCDPPPGLKRELAYVQENDRDFLQGVSYGLSLAAKSRGLDYRRDIIENDGPRAAALIKSMNNQKVGAMVATVSNQFVIAESLKEVIASGAFVGSIVPPPATLLLNAPQYKTGKALTDAAIAYINTNLGGKADVALLTQDSTQFLSPRFAAMRDGLSQLPGVNIIADISPSLVSKEGGEAAMNTILVANPNIDVVLGADAVVLGALAALRATGKARPDQFLGGIDGEPEAIVEIMKSDSPFKASVALSSPVFGYAMGQYAADWLEGKSIPQAMDILPIALTADNIAQYEADLSNPDAVFADPVRRATYLNMYGNICYNTRDQYVNFPWSSEQE